MRIQTVLFATAVLAIATGTSAGQSPLRTFELLGSGGFSDGPGYASKAPQVGTSASFGTSWLRVSGGGSYAWLHKQSTPSGGFQQSTYYSVEGGARNVFLLAGLNHNYSDQACWTKTVDYRFGGIGYRWAGGWRGDRATSINEVRALYYREFRSTYANRTEFFSAGYSWDRMLKGALYLRLSLRLGVLYFDDNPYPGAARRHGAASSFNIGLVARP